MYTGNIYITGQRMLCQSVGQSTATVFNSASDKSFALSNILYVLFCYTIFITRSHIYVREVMKNFLVKDRFFECFCDIKYFFSIFAVLLYEIKVLLHVTKYKNEVLIKQR
jgi:hypothetical protein